MVKGSGSGWFRRKGGRLLYCWYNDAGRERTKAVGDASMTDAEAWIEVANLDLNKQVGKPDPKNAKFGGVLDHWLAYGKTKTGEEKDDSTKETDKRDARKHLSPWADRVAKDIEPLEVQQWLDNQSYGMRSKLRSMMSAVYRHGQKFGFIPRGEECNPMKLVSAPTKTDYEAVQLSGKEAALVIRQIADPLVKVLVILIAVTGMRISEALALVWSDVDSVRQRIRIRRKWGRKGYGPPKQAPGRDDCGACRSAPVVAAGNDVCRRRRLALPVRKDGRRAATVRRDARRRLCPSRSDCCGRARSPRRAGILRRRTRRAFRLP